MISQEECIHCPLCRRDPDELDSGVEREGREGPNGMTRVTNLLGCTYPVIQGAMGVICNPELVAAVSEAGGFGLLATGFVTDAGVVRDQVRATKALTQKPFGANIFASNPIAVQIAEMLGEEEIAAVTISGGSPKPLVPLCHDRGVKAIVVVGTADAARKSEDLGADAIVAEGSESGGIQGFRGASTMVLVPAVVDAVKVPVIAAGGIGDSRGFRAALALGAEGVQVGTRFIATRECIAHPNYKNSIIDSTEIGTGLIDLGRFRLRSLRTELAERILSGERSGTFSGSEAEQAWIHGDMEAGLLPAGEVSGLIDGIASVKEIVEALVA